MNDRVLIHITYNGSSTQSHTNRLQVSIVLIRQRHLGGLLHLLLVLLQQVLVNLDLRRSQSWGGNELQLRVTNQLTGQPKEWLLEVVVGLGRNVVVLQVLLSVESDGSSLDLTLLDVDLVTTQHNWDVLTNSDQVTVPVRNVLVGDSRGNVEHDDTTLTVDVVTVSQASELLLAGSVPDVELQLSEVGVEAQWVDLDTQGSNVLLFELTSQMSLDEGGFTSTTVSDEDQFEGRDFSSSHDVCVCF